MTDVSRQFDESLRANLPVPRGTRRLTKLPKCV